MYGSKVKIEVACCLQGLRIAWADEQSGIALLEMLNDVPSYANASTAGWDVLPVEPPSDWITISFSTRDGQGFASGT